MEPTTGELTGTKKIVVLTIVGVTLAMAVAGMFIPEARVYISDITKGLLTAATGVMK